MENLVFIAFLVAQSAEIIIGEIPNLRLKFANIKYISNGLIGMQYNVQ